MSNKLILLFLLLTLSTQTVFAGKLCKALVKHSNPRRAELQTEVGNFKQYIHTITANPALFNASQFRLKMRTVSRLSMQSIMECERRHLDSRTGKACAGVHDDQIYIQELDSLANNYLATQNGQLLYDMALVIKEFEVPSCQRHK